MKPREIAAYYTNFLSYISGNKSTTDYYAFFDNDVPEDYEVAAFLNLHLKKNDSIFVWGNSAQIYTLTSTLPPGRYTVAYHIHSKAAFSETQKAIDLKKPRYIVIQPGISLPQLQLSAYSYLATIGATDIYERTY